MYGGKDRSMVLVGCTVIIRGLGVPEVGRKEEGEGKR
jgi:hypothetical protein